MHPLVVAPRTTSPARGIDLTRMPKSVRTLFGWLIFRRISMPLSARVARTAVTPTQLTVAGLCCGLTGAGLIATGRYAEGVAGALAACAAKILDAMDGEVARAKGVATSGGYVLDGLTDRLRDAALIVGVGVGATRAGFRPGLAWTVGAIAGYLFFFYLSAAAPSHWREPESSGEVDEKHSFRVGSRLRLGAGDTLVVAVGLATSLSLLPVLVVLIAVSAPFAIAVKARTLASRRPWEHGAGARTGGPRP